jgi:hypothetical protein
MLVANRAGPGLAHPPVILVQAPYPTSNQYTMSCPVQPRSNNTNCWNKTTAEKFGKPRTKALAGAYSPLVIKFIIAYVASSRL